ncbi:bromodomain adjacent to zinc finger domain protein 2B isoform X2 [Nematostella vectensis]|uniref:bromodomain adjacent to zinc finger domain protein 2B isoform X2 n=1 Tax=Nematostella vectensis TaxID=45351 RepID=UPI0020774BBB|nr:bromodomain adjacent to zinc finger domain protein 2B isoform X2 [Nematostella vectensis]
MDRRDVPNQSPVNAHSFFDNSGHPNPMLRSPALSHERPPYGMHSLPSAFSMMSRRPGLSHSGQDFLSQDPILGSQASMSPPGTIHSGLGVGNAGPGWPWMSAHPHMTSPDYFSSHIPSGWLGGHDHDQHRDRVDECLFPNPRSHGGIMNGVSNSSSYAAGSGIFYPHPASPTPQIHSFTHHSSPVTMSKSWSNQGNHNQRVTYDHSDNHHDLDLFSPQMKSRHPSLSLSDDPCGMDIPSFPDTDGDKHGPRGQTDATGGYSGLHFSPKDHPMVSPKQAKSTDALRSPPIPSMKSPSQTAIRSPSQTKPPPRSESKRQEQQNSKPTETRGNSHLNTLPPVPAHRPPQPVDVLPPPPKLAKTKPVPPPRLQVPKSILNDCESVIPSKPDLTGTLSRQNKHSTVKEESHAQNSSGSQWPALLNSKQSGSNTHMTTATTASIRERKLSIPERPSVLQQSGLAQQAELPAKSSIDVARPPVVPISSHSAAPIAPTTTTKTTKSGLPEPPKVPSGKPLAMARFRVPFNNQETSDEESDGSSEVSSESESGSDAESEEGEGEGEEVSSGSDSSTDEEGTDDGDEEGGEEDDDDDDDDDENQSGILAPDSQDGTKMPSLKRKQQPLSTGSPKRRRRAVDDDAVMVPLELGWKRQTRLRPLVAATPGGSRGDVFYFAPCGKKLRTYPEVARYLTRNNITNITVDNFSFSTKLYIGEVYECKDENNFELLSEEEVKSRREAAAIKKKASEMIANRREKKRQAADMAKKAQESKMRKKMEKLMAAEESKRAKQQRAESRKLKKLERQQALQQAKQAKREQVRIRAQQKKIAKEQEKQQRRLAKMRRQEQLRIEKEMRAQQAQEDRELKRQQAILLKQQEREQKRQQQMMIRALEIQQKADERERQKEEKRMEKKLIKERKLEQKRRELILTRELKKPVEDMVLRDAKPLPEIPRLSKCILPGKAFADLLMVEEFVHNFGGALDIDPAAEMPSISDMQLSMLCQGEDVLLPLCQLLLTQAMADPGCDGPYAVTKLGQPLHKVELTDNNTSEILRLFVMSRNGGPNELSDALEEQPFQSLSPVQKGSVLAFLVNELLCSRVIIKEIENSIETMSNLRKDKWIIEGRIRKLKAIQAEKYPVVKIKKPPGRPRNVDTTSIDNDNSRDAASIADSSIQGNDDDDDEEEEEDDDDEEEEDDDEDGEGGGNGSGSSDESEEEEDDKEPQTQEELEGRLQKLEKKHAKFRTKLFGHSHSLRALTLGQDRFKRRYWVLPHTGGVFAEGLTSAEKDGMQSDIPAQGDRERVENLDINSAITEGTQRQRNSQQASVKMEQGAITPLQSSVNGTSCLETPTTPKHSIPVNTSAGPSSQSQFIKIENLIKSSDGATSAVIVSPSQNLVVSQIIPQNTCNNWFSLLPRMPCDESSLTLSHTPLSGNFVPTYSKKAEIVLMDSPIPIKRPPGRPPKNAAQIVYQPNLVSLFGSGSPNLMSSPGSAAASPEKRGPCTSASSTSHVSTMSLSFEELKKSVLESLRQEPAPIPPEVQHGWWRLTEPSNIKELVKACHSRGIREKMLQKNFQKYSEYISSSCKKPFCDEDDDSETDEEDEKTEDKLAEGTPVDDNWFPAAEFAVNKAIMKEVEELEEKVFAASLQVKGWKLPAKVTKGLTYNPEAKTDPENNLLSMAATRLAAVELGIERRYLKHPFRDDKVQIPTNIGTALAPGEVPSAEAQEEENKTSPGKSSGNITHALKVWRAAVASVSNASQLAMCLSMLVGYIAWDKSIMKVFCQMCRKGDNEELLLLCDGCDRGYHTYCCMPKLTTIPEGDWYCMDCIVLAAGGDNCCVCGGPAGKMAKCDNCPRNFHLKCLEPPLVKMPRVSWTCPKCKKRRAKNSTPRRKREKKKHSESDSLRDIDFEMSQDGEDEEGDNQETRHHINRKQQSKDMAPCRTILAEMEKHDDAWPFLIPVNAKQFPEYYKIIRKPMDFHTMKIKLRDYQYSSPQEFAQDSRLVFANCEEFNEDDSEVGQAGKRLSKFFESRWSDLCQGS